MSDFAHEIKKLSRSQWITKGAAKTLEAFHKAATAQAVKEERERMLEKILFMKYRTFEEDAYLLRGEVVIFMETDNEA